MGAVESALRMGAAHRDTLASPPQELQGHAHRSCEQRGVRAEAAVPLVGHPYYWFLSLISVVGAVIVLFWPQVRVWNEDLLPQICAQPPREHSKKPGHFPSEQCHTYFIFNGYFLTIIKAFSHADTSVL
ncbi:hypothetical protein UY3_07313 [Chelonia mydas]|uniref:Uncharacterized protein n=1 Tax=Chelonia mydas TaxID=8469 RepID=M7BTU5_CHEMY|nr:hypothetical protein UY3_07313 [Chelonia mydas]